MQKQEFRNLHCVWGNNKKGRLKRNSFVHLCTYWWQIKGDVWGVVHSAQWVACRLWPLLCAFYLNMFCFLLQSCVTFFGHKITWLIKSQPHEADQQCTVLFTYRKKVSFNIASEASSVYILSGKMPKMVLFREFLTTWSLRSNSVIRQANFNLT